MTREQLDQIRQKWAVLTTSAMHATNPIDDYDRWRRQFADLAGTVDEIRMLLTYA